MLEAYKEQVGTRAIQRLLSSRTPSSIPPSSLPPGTQVLYFYKSTKKCDPVEWRPGMVIAAETYLVRLKTASGRVLSVTYEGLRLRPYYDIPHVLMEGDMDKAISNPEGGRFNQLLWKILRATIF